MWDKIHPLTPGTMKVVEAVMKATKMPQLSN
jgi:hypothetical protein